MPTPPVFTAADCPPPPAGTPPAGTETDPAVRVGCDLAGLGGWFDALPARLADLAVTWWPWLLTAALAAVLLYLVARRVHRVLWRRAVGRGYWVQLTPPRTLDPTHAGHVWRLLAGVARRTRGGWHLVKPPLAFEVYAAEGRLTAGLWLPRTVPLAAVVAEAERAWPGVRAERRPAPTVAGGPGWRVAGYRLRATGTDLAALTDDPPTSRVVRGAGADHDPLRSVLAALARPDGPAVLQVLVRPAPGKRLAALGHAARYPAKPRRGAGSRAVDLFSGAVYGSVRLLLDLVAGLLSTGSSPRRTSGHGGGSEGRRAVNPLAAQAMRDAADKLRDGPHLHATVRVGVARPDAGFAVTAAHSIADGYVTAARDRLAPVRLRRAAVALTDRWAGRGDWLLCTATELGTLAHFPADPARYGFDTAALHRPPPGTARRAAPERPTDRAPGWTRNGWSTPAADDEHNAGPDSDDEHDDDRDDWWS